MNLIDLTDAQAQAAARTKAASSSFYWAMRGLPLARRHSIYAVYAFCREVDDIADSDLPAADKLAALETWQVRIDRLYHPAAAATFLLEAPLRRAIELHGLRRRDFRAVIEGMMMDAEGPMVAPSRARLDLYCDRVACAVGRLSVKVFGLDDPEGGALAGALGRALQLTNILRDVGEDAARGRLYLPAETLAEHGITLAGGPVAVLADANLPAAARAVAAQARGHFADAQAVMRRCPSEPVRPARLMAAVYGALLDRLEAEGWRHPQRRARLGALHKAWLVMRCTWGKA